MLVSQRENLDSAAKQSTHFITIFIFCLQTRQSIFCSESCTPSLVDAEKLLVIIAIMIKKAKNFVPKQVKSY